MSTVSRLCVLVGAAVALNGSLAIGQSAGPAIDPAKRAAVLQLLEITKTADQVLLGMELAIPMQRAANPRIPDAFWDRFSKRARDKRGELLEALVPIYDRNFSLSDLNELIRFYKSPLGTRLLTATPQLTREAMLEGQKWGARIGQEIGEELTREGIGPKS